MTKLHLHCGRVSHAKATHCKRCDHTLTRAMALEPARGTPPLLPGLLLMVVISVVTVGMFFWL